MTRCNETFRSLKSSRRGSLLLWTMVASCLCGLYFIPKATYQTLNATNFIKPWGWPFVFEKDCEKPESPSSCEHVAQDPDLVQHVRERVLVRAPSIDGDYKLDHPEVDDPSMANETSKIMSVIFPEKRDGVFFEAGVLDGESSSTSLYLERKLGWSGLIVEMNPMNLDLVRQKRRKALFAPVCLSPKQWPVQRLMQVRFDPAKIQSREVASISKLRWRQDEAERKASPKKFEATVDCYPLQTLLMAANMTTIDYMSLDIEGEELPVLRTLDWDKVDIQVLRLDLLHTRRDEGFDATRDFLLKKGYAHIYGESEPVLFVKEDLFKSLQAT